MINLSVVWLQKKAVVLRITNIHATLIIHASHDAISTKIRSYVRETPVLLLYPMSATSTILLSPERRCISHTELLLPTVMYQDNCQTLSQKERFG